mmetsp:Transcript_107646/g.321964  ORF Transcript_107646/g.321964 Transcript_107646/m.321964 type:complete len:257 (-) Transcript_107646:1709-2479(-)
MSEGRSTPGRWPPPGDSRFSSASSQRFSSSRVSASQRALRAALSLAMAFDSALVAALLAHSSCSRSWASLSAWARCSLETSSCSLVREDARWPSVACSCALMPWMSACSVFTCSCERARFCLASRSSWRSASRWRFEVLSPSSCWRWSCSCLDCRAWCSAFSRSKVPWNCANLAVCSCSWLSSRCRCSVLVLASRPAILAERSLLRRSVSAAAASAARRWFSDSRWDSRSAKLRSWALSSCSTARKASKSAWAAWL